ncbi:50S ribosomal protein L19 [Patescibacteria group bacterium]|nr:50S ribosomal protein L19 [Patescibacteria group bacterium]
MSLKITHSNSDFFVGDSIRVNYRIKEKDKERIQAFDGILIAIKNGNFIVQKNATDGVRVERIFPIFSPWIESIKKLRSPKTKVRRAKLYYLRDAKAKTL